MLSSTQSIKSIRHSWHRKTVFPRNRIYFPQIDLKTKSTILFLDSNYGEFHGETDSLIIPFRSIFSSWRSISRLHLGLVRYGRCLIGSASSVSIMCWTREVLPS